jgi:formylglycine-generating enzyme required for sulfatase activity
VQIAAPPNGMSALPGGTFAMGSEEFYPEEAPVREAAVGPFAIDRHPVTVAEFRRFVTDTGYVTVAERPLDPALYPDADPDQLVPGSLVFHRTAAPVSLDDVRAWWRYVPGASWHAPGGPGSTVRGRHRHPVTHVAYEDALAYARWAGKDLPTEPEWEYAARGGLERARFAWGDELAPGGKIMANTWHGRFPFENTRADGYEGTSPVGAFAPNGFGLYDLCGNVWEWTRDGVGAPGAPAACCAPPPAPERIPRNVIKGGSHLCAPSYCLRFRPAARQFEAVDTSTSHLGFRCVVRPA